jgi:microcystin-dependent protein
MMIGEIKAYAGSVVPLNHLLCDGSAVSRSVYAKLFAVIGTAFGAGDGSTTFNLPDLRSRVAVGFNSGDVSFNALGKTGGADSFNNAHGHTQTDHTHLVSGNTNNSGGAQGSGSGKTTASTVHYHSFGPFTSSGASNLGTSTNGNASQTVLNPYVTVNFIIQHKISNSSFLKNFILQE